MESNLDNRTSPQPLPSLPPSPTTSEDLSRAHAWTEQDTDDERTPQKKDTGKSREVIGLNDEGETSEEEGGGSYPPTNEDATETRRIEDVSLGRMNGLIKSILTAYNSIESSEMGNGRTTTTESCAREYAGTQIASRGCHTTSQSTMVWKNQNWFTPVAE
jgi:hypothetical protein